MIFGEKLKFRYEQNNIFSLKKKKKKKSIQLIMIELSVPSVNLV